MKLSGIVLAVSVLVVATEPLRAQDSSSKVTSRELQAARSAGSALGASRVLGQTDGSMVRETLDELADSLAAMVINDTNTTLAAQQLRLSSVRALMMAGNQRASVPYVGAGVRLRRIALNAPDIGDRAAAVYALTRLSSTSESLALLKDVATSKSIAALSAVRQLWDSMKGRGGLEVLKHLSSTNEVVQPEAKSELARVALKHGW